ncbi:MAG: hypothetical protein WCT28_03090 [Patescibacteria group bacterium]|jgi:hypothetical protein
MKSIGKICILIVAIAPVVWLSWLSASPNGERTVSWVPGEFSPFITSPLPGERVSSLQTSDRGSFISLIGDPTYIGVFSPSNSFTSATVSVEFDPHSAYAFEIGGLTNIAAYAFDFHAFSNSAIESLDWTRLNSDEQSNFLVFAKDDAKLSVQDFLNHQPARSSIATYRATLPGVYRESSYVPLNGNQTFNVSLRGSHEYVTYIKNEPFRLDVMYQDINRTFGADEGYVRVYSEDGTVMVNELIVDDGNISEDQAQNAHSISLSSNGWPEGVYRVELSGTSDIVWRQFVIGQRYMAFKNRLFLADDEGYLLNDRQTKFVTNSTSVVFETLHANSAQSISFDGTDVEIPAPYTKVRTVSDASGIVEGVTDAGDVKMIGEGKFALSRTAFFDPDPRALTATTDIDSESIEFVVANLPSISKTGDGWRTASATFALSDLVTESGAYKFALSLPGQGIDGEVVDVHKISVTFHKDPISLWRAVWEEARLWKHALEERLW